MPRVEVAADGANKNIATLLGSGGPLTGWAQGVSYQADPDNGDVLKIGGSGMTATDYDFELAAGDSAPDSASEGARLLTTRYVRNDSASPQHLIITFEGT